MINNEKEHIHEIEAEVLHLNENSILKPHAYQTLFSQIAENHLNTYRLNVDTTMNYGLAWALVSLNIEIRKPIDRCMKLYATTWHSQHKRPYFRRELDFRDENGEVRFVGSTFSVLLDMEKRTVYRNKELPFYMPDPFDEILIEATPNLKTKLDFEAVEKRKVYNSYIDCLGHVNNCRYAEFAYDAFTPEEKANLHKMKRMEVYFISELRPEDTFSIMRAQEEDKLVFRGYNDVKENTAFDIVMYFDK